MKLKIETKKLLDLLTKVSSAVATKSPMPILTGVLLNANETTLNLTATNNEISIYSNVSDDSMIIEEEGIVLVNAKMLLEILRKTKSTRVTIETQENNLILRTNSGEYKLNVMDKDSFPAIDFDCENSKVTISTTILRSLINDTIFATSNNDRKPVLTGVNLLGTENQIVAVATDSFRLARRTEQSSLTELFNITIPKKSLLELLKVFNGDELLHLDISATKLVVWSEKEKERIAFATRLLEGGYPDTSRLIPTSFPTIVKVNRERLIDTIDRIALLSASEGDSKSIIEMKIKDTLVITSNSNFGVGKEEIELIEKEGNDISILANANYMLDSLKCLTSENVILNFVNDSRPFVIYEEKNTDKIQLILPMRR